MRERCANKRTAVAMSNGNIVLGPVSGKRLDLISGNTADGLGPFWRFRNTVLAAGNIVLEPIEAYRMGFDVFFS